MTRLPRQPGERLDRQRTVRFTFDGRAVKAYAGDTIGSALYAAGQRTFSRSFKYHRRRGLFCCAGQCPNCLVAVDGAPGVRACTEPVREQMRVVHMNARPSLDFDLMRATDLLASRLTPPGFYYKTFTRPRRMWPVYERVLRHAAGLGRLPRHQAERAWRTEHRHRHTDVLVVGGGGAGLRAAIAAAELGADVVLVDDGPEPGGRLAVEGDHARARELAHWADAAGVEILTSASALGFFDGLVSAWQGDVLHRIRARQHVFATGTVEQPLVFAGNDLPGVMLSGGARRLASLYAVRPGTAAVLATTSDQGLEAALALRDAGVEIRAVADLRGQPGPAAAALGAETEVHAGSTIVAARGRKRVREAVIAPLDDGTGERRYECDLVLVSGGVSPASSLIVQAGARATYDNAREHFAVSGLPDGVHAAGRVAGAADPATAGLTGAAAGLDAAHALGLGDASSLAETAELRAELGAYSREASAGVVPPAVSGAGRGKCFACICEDVTAADIRASVAEGYDSVELSKRYTTVTMGPCQGRMCQLPATRLIAADTAVGLDDLGTTTARPPWSAVPLGALAGRPFEPAKRSPIHRRHRELGATVRWTGTWRRAYDYGDAEAEALAVHEGVGLTDVSTLGKLLVRGPDAGAFLDRLYPNRFSDLAPGRVRYGVLTSEAGRITDDGTICRLDEETFYVTTTSGGAEHVEQWFSWWLAQWRLRVHVDDLSQALAAISVAGPGSRSLLSRLSDLDFGAERFRYMDGKTARLAGVECLLLRIGFVGELGYEIHFPGAHGEHLWERIEAHGARPFGLAAQRLLRLQKMHILVGQDTDSESTPFGAAMPWIVKLDKPGDFIGRWALEHAAEHPPETALVGFELPSGPAPAEGAVVIDAEGEPAGEVTSAAYSPQLGRAIGMAWVPAALARDGAELQISDDGRALKARVVTEPFYDPAGEVLRS